MLYSAAGTGQIPPAFRLSCGRQKWAMGPFPETEEKVQETVPRTSGGHIQKFSKSSIAPHVNTCIKSHLVQLCIVFLNQDLRFRVILWVSQMYRFCYAILLSSHQVSIQSQYREHCICSQTACVERQLYYQLCDSGHIGLCGPQPLICKWGNTYSIKFS